MKQRSGDAVTIQTVQQVFGAASLRRLCIVIAYPNRTAVPEPGTGTAVRHGGELFVVTCQHVAGDFFSMSAGELLFLRLPRVPRASCSLVYADEKLDLAVIHVSREAAARLNGLEPLSIADFGDARAFRRATARSKWNYVVAGFPGALASFGPESNRITLNPLIFGTTVRRRRGLKLTLDYEHGLKEGKQLVPEGMSGSLVFEMREPVGKDLWEPGIAVGVQHAWNDVKRTLVCSPVHPCVRAIKRYSKCGSKDPATRREHRDVQS